MVLLSVSALLIHAYIFAKGVTFFRTVGDARENDKSIVASLMGLSVLFILAQLVAWHEQPWRMLTDSNSGVMFMAFIFAEAFFNLAITTNLTHRREEHGCSTRRG